MQIPFRNLLAFLPVIWMSMLPASVSGQENDFPRQAFSGSAMISAGDKAQSGAADLHHRVSFGKTKWLSAYYGIRYSALLDQHTDLTNKNTCDCSITVSPENKNHHSVNLMIGGMVSYKQLFLGFDIDVAGINLNADDEYTLTYSGYPRNPSPYISISSLTVQAETNRYNLLRAGYNDIGMLNSSFYAGYRLNHRFTLKAGINHFFIQYAELYAPAPSDKGKAFYNLGFAGVTYTFFHR